MKQKIQAYSTLRIKAVSEESRTITGIASTPESDRMGDIVEPKGANFKLPIPLLWQHDHSEPIGEVINAKVTEKGIEIVAKLAKIEREGKLKDRLEDAWEAIKSGLVRGLSIGFSPIDYKFLDDGDGIRFTKWNWHELSAVTIPANASANIQTIKAFDIKSASAHRPSVPSDHRQNPSVVGKPKTKKTYLSTHTGDSKMNLSEQIKSYKSKLKELQDERVSLMEKSADEGATLDAEQGERFDDLETEITSVKKHLKRLEAIQEDEKEQAKPVQGDTQEKGAQSRGERPTFVQVKSNHAENGLALAQVVKCLGRAQGNHFSALQIAESAGASLDPRVKGVLKAAVAAGTTSNSSWSGDLVGEETSVYADFIEFLRPRTIIGRFGQNGLPALRTVPFRVPLVGQTTGGQGYWVGEGKAKPLTKMDFARRTLEPLKVANIAVVTEETLRSSSPSADLLIRDSLVAALAERLDIDFMNPDKSASAGLSPASITNGVKAIKSSGNTAEDVDNDIKALFGTFIAANNAPTFGVWIMSSTTALALSLLKNPLGQKVFPNLTMTGGEFQAMPVIVSDYVPAGMVTLANASDIYIGDEGGFQVDLSREASIEMSDDPTGDATTGRGSQLVSLWQTNSVGFRAEREINWAKRRESAVAVLSDVKWGQPSAETTAPGAGYTPDDEA